MRRWAVPFLLLLLALIAAALALRPPSPKPASAPPGVFSAARAMADVRAIAQRPHPIGSADARRVQDYLIGRMTALGLDPQPRPFDSVAGPGRNLLGVLPGRDRQAPALLLMAHSDSVPRAPGAADDSAGVAAVLETIRALQTTPRQRDVMVLFTDGEEAGLLGAKSFFSTDPARAHIGVVINLEARGDRGRAVMFETHRSAAPLIAALNDADALAGASSLMPDLYRRLPNDTDLTWALKQGHQGLNFAFFAGFDAYHTALDTPERLDQGSLQDMGDKVLRAARVLADLPALPGRAPDQTYADVLGGPVLQYPPSLGWAIVLLAAAGAGAYALRIARPLDRQLGRLTLPGVAWGALAFVALILVLAAVFYGLGVARIAAAGHHLAPLLRHAGEARAGVGLVALGVALLWFALAGRRLKPDSLSFGALAVLAIGAVALQAAAPLDAFILAWPFLLIGLAVTLGGPDRPWPRAVILLAALAQILYWAGLVFDLVGQTTPMALAPFAPLAAAALLPVAPRDGPKAAVAGAAAAAVGVALSLLATLP